MKRLLTQRETLNQILKFAEELGWVVALPKSPEVEEGEEPSLLGITMGVEDYIEWMVPEGDEYHTVFGQNKDNMH